MSTNISPFVPETLCMHLLGSNILQISILLLQIWNSILDECELTLAGNSCRIECFDYYIHGSKTYLITGSQDNTAKVNLIYIHNV